MIMQDGKFEGVSQRLLEGNVLEKNRSRSCPQEKRKVYEALLLRVSIVVTSDVGLLGWFGPVRFLGDRS
jgi:hypothetical protein